MLAVRSASRWWLIWVLVWGLGVTGCLMPLCQNASLGTQEHKLRGIWNALQHIQDKKSLEVWVSRFLDHLLAGTPYQLKSTGSTFIVIDPTQASSVCRVSTQTQQKQLRHPQFLARLHRIYQQHQLSLQSYVYRPAQEFTVRSQQVQATGENCQSRQYLTDLVYWKSISTPYSQAYWKEACTLGQQLKRWEICFPLAFREIFQQRMAQICR